MQLIANEGGLLIMKQAEKLSTQEQRLGFVAKCGFAISPCIMSVQYTGELS